MLLLHMVRYQSQRHSVWLFVVAGCSIINCCVVSIIVSAAEAAPSTESCQTHSYQTIQIFDAMIYKLRELTINCDPSLVFHTLYLLNLV